LKYYQARNQLGTSGGAKSFLIGAQIFLAMSNNFKLYPTHFSRGGDETFSRGGLRPSGYGPEYYYYNGPKYNGQELVHLCVYK